MLEIAVDIQGGVEYAEDLDCEAVTDEIGDAVVAVDEDADFTLGLGTVPVSEQGEGLEKLNLLVNGIDDALGCLGIILGDVALDVLKPDDGLLSPPYFCHSFMRLPISSLEIVRAARESARPRSTMRSNASSRRISS